MCPVCAPDIHMSGTVHVPKRENAIVNRLNKTKEERVVDHEQERIERLKRESAARRVAAAEQVSTLSSRSVINFIHAHLCYAEKSGSGAGPCSGSREGCAFV
jgi:hypothetical protein